MGLSAGLVLLAPDIARFAQCRTSWRGKLSAVLRGHSFGLLWQPYAFVPMEFERSEYDVLDSQRSNHNSYLRIDSELEHVFDVGSS